ncbi:MAG: FAD-dependent oxidoreductase [Clostridia bacterium]|nr:FAD-dependent oxidoreductase [Clostridia bacterium]
MKERSVLIVGGGPAGLAAAVAAYDAGVRDVLIVERDSRVGGILKQCIHPGFGLHRFGCELTGPEYAERYAEEVRRRGIEVRTGTFVTGVTPERVVTLQSREGIEEIRAGAVVLAMGCRERPRGALNIPGTRPAGIYTAGTAQRLINVEGYLPGRRVVILGSGDIGLITARRMTLEGAKVLAVCELLPYSGGLARNIEQCLNDFDIPLLLSHTVTEIHGKERLTGVTVSSVDENRRPIPGTERFFDCDTLLLSVGLIPENELTEKLGLPLDRRTGGAAVDTDRQTAIPGVFACGNVLHVHDLVDYVSGEAELAGKAAAAFAKGELAAGEELAVTAGAGIRYTVPQRVRRGETAEIYFRFSDVSRKVEVYAEADGTPLAVKKLLRAAPGEMQKLKVSVPADSANLTIKMRPQA